MAIYIVNNSAIVNKNNKTVAEQQDEPEYITEFLVSMFFFSLPNPYDKKTQIMISLAYNVSMIYLGVLICSWF